MDVSSGFSERYGEIYITGVPTEYNNLRMEIWLEENGEVVSNVWELSMNNASAYPFSAALAPVISDGGDSLAVTVTNGEDAPKTVSLHAGVFRGGALCGFITREVHFEAYETKILAAVEKPRGAEDGDFRLFVWDEN
jgi:hypothetical protein